MLQILWPVLCAESGEVFHTARVNNCSVARDMDSYVSDRARCCRRGKLCHYRRTHYHHLLHSLSSLLYLTLQATSHLNKRQIYMKIFIMVFKIAYILIFLTKSEISTQARAHTPTDLHTYTKLQTRSQKPYNRNTKRFTHTHTHT